VNIPAHFSAILERLVGMLVLGLKDVDSIGRLKNVYLVPIVVNLLLQLVDDAHYISEGTMLPDTIIDFDQKVFDQRCKKDFD
jgi:hypothetical protein